MSQENSITNKIGIYNALIAWGILVLFLILQLIRGSNIIFQILPSLIALTFITSLVLFWRGRANARRILENNDSLKRIIIEGGIIGAIFFPLLMLVFTWKIFFSPPYFWEDSAILSQTIYVFALIVFLGIITGCMGGFVFKKFNEKTISKLENN